MLLMFWNLINKNLKILRFVGGGWMMMLVALSFVGGGWMILVTSFVGGGWTILVTLAFVGDG